MKTDSFCLGIFAEALNAQIYRRCNEDSAHPAFISELILQGNIVRIFRLQHAVTLPKMDICARVCLLI
jgi:hypothetical protein